MDITKTLRSVVMAGPVVLPYGDFPTTDSNAPVWSDSLQDWLVARYQNAMPVLEEVAEYAAREGVKVAIEPVGHWEHTPDAYTVAREALAEVRRQFDSASYLASSRYAWCSLTAGTAAAAATLRRPVRTSLNTAIRLRSRSLIDSHPILRT